MAKPPGSELRYSAGGYCVVQKAVEDVTGEPFEMVMNKSLLEPLQMSRSHFHSTAAGTGDTTRHRGYCRMETAFSITADGVSSRKKPARVCGPLPQDLAKLIMAVQKAKAGEDARPDFPCDCRGIPDTAIRRPDGNGGLPGRRGPNNRGFFHGGENLGYFARFGAGVNVDRAWVIMTNGKKDRFDPIVKAIAEEFGWFRPGRRPGEMKAKYKHTNLIAKDWQQATLPKRMLVRRTSSSWQTLAETLTRRTNRAILILQRKTLYVRCRDMTKLLEEAFKKASKLPEVEQNALAKWLLEELEDEKKWEKEFSESEDVLDQLADEAVEEHRKGKTKPMDFGRL